MTKIREIDGLSSQQRIDNIKVTGEIKLLDDRLHAMGQRLAYFYHFINYYNLQNKKDGSFSKLIKSSVFFAISSIREYNLKRQEQDFIGMLGANYYNQTTKEEVLVAKIIEMISLFESWLNSTSYFGIHEYELTLRADLINQVVVNLQNSTLQLSGYIEKKLKNITFPTLSGIWGTEEIPVSIGNTNRFFKSVFYKYMNSIQFLQKNVDRYEDELFSSGYNDPAIAIYIAFLQNHSRIITSFNNRWKEYTAFYFDKIVKAKPARAMPDKTILQINKNGENEWVNIEQGTVFTDGNKIKFKATEPLMINNIELKSVLGLYEEEDELIEPASWLGHVTAIRKVDLSQLINSTETGKPAIPFFEQKGKKGGGGNTSISQYSSVGLMIRSWALLLKEGVRKITISLILTDESLISFQSLIESICEKWGEMESDVVYKLLNDIFYITISTSEGWRNIESYTIQFVNITDNPSFEIGFSVDESFPIIGPLETEKSTPPSVKLQINRNAWLFPYSWLKEFEFNSIKVFTEVTGLTNVQLYSELGKLDTTMPFSPFGMIPSRGAWMVFGNYEMAIKKIKHIDIKIKWANLPSHDYGFADYYFHYKKGIDNCSFIIEPEVLKNRKWVQTKKNRSYYLFNTETLDNEAGTLPKAPLNSESLLRNIVPEDFKRIKSREDEFAFNMFASNGFFRLKLISPEMGFGHQHYHQILSDVLMHNARSRKLVESPNLPFSPQAEFISISYAAEDEISSLHAYEGYGEALYHLHPYGEFFLDVYSTRKPFKIIPDFESKGSLLFGLDRVAGNETIKLYIILEPQQKEINRNRFPEIIWYYGDGYKWSMFSQNDIIRDETNNLLESGIIEIKIPSHIPDKETSMGNLFWIKAAIVLNVENLSDVKGFYLHVVKAERVIDNSDQETLAGLNTLPQGQITTLEQHLPGVSSINQLTATSGGKIAEDEKKMRVRLAERIAHRNRAVTAIDFEKIILENFIQIRKAKCFPCVDSKQNRPGVVTIAIIPETEQKVRAPMASCMQLIEIEDFLQKCTSMFATVDVINPMYEYLQVRCKITLVKTRSEGYYLRLLNHEINNYIAFWESHDEAPVFGHSISLIDLANFIRSREYVLRVKNFSVLHLVEKQEFLYELVEKREIEQEANHDLKTSIKVLINKHEIKIKELKPISPSKQWSIIIPMEKHLLVADWEDQIDKAGINELEIGNTFVIS